MDMRRLVGRNVRRRREKKGLTQEQFADISGFSQQYISSLERGRRNPTVITLYEISTALGVSPRDLLRPSKVTQRPYTGHRRARPGSTK
jgi:transcriptional regulator with XRE-family HTH domain